MIIVQKPYDLAPSQDAYLAAGFLFLEKDGYLVISLPSGWTQVDIDETTIKIMDLEKRVRAIFTHGSEHDQTSRLILKPYYRIVIRSRFINCPQIPIPHHWAHYMAVINYAGAEIFIPGDLQGFYGISIFDKFAMQCRHYLEVYYPQWQNPNAYW